MTTPDDPIPRPSGSASEASAAPREAADSREERRRRSNRLAFQILGGAAGCGCLWFVFAFCAGGAVGFYNAMQQQQELRRMNESPTPDDDEEELRLRQ